MQTARPPKEVVLEKLRLVATEQNRVHVIPSNGSWAVKREDRRRASRVLADKKEAIELARSLARKHSMVGIVVHGRDARFESIETISL
jgi:hypothetical protein